VVDGRFECKTWSSDEYTREQVDWEFGENGRRSDNGRLVLDMMKQIGLVNQGGQTPLPPGAAGDVGFWYTRFDPKRKVTHAIDYILITGGLRRQGSAFKVDYTHLGSDHHLTEVTCPREIQKRKKREVKVCFRWRNRSEVVERE
jgi:hypothetical protein